VSGKENLLREGIPAKRINFVGNSLIDSLRSHLNKAVARAPWRRFTLEPGCYGLVTLHRPANVDDPDVFSEIGLALKEVSSKMPLLFPAHPRTRECIEQFPFDWSAVNIVEPLGYLDFLGLMTGARLVLTDSGGVQEETTALGIPCVTIRPNTERPVTVERGTNRIAGIKKKDIIKAVHDAMSCGPVNTAPPLFWDGHASSRIVDVIEEWLPVGRQSVFAGTD